MYFRYVFICLKKRVLALLLFENSFDYFKFVKHQDILSHNAFDCIFLYVLAERAQTLFYQFK